MANEAWCDWEYGNDSTGNGTKENPYKTILRASEDIDAWGPSVNMHVKVAETINPRTAISFPLVWTHGSRMVLANGDITSEVSQFDIIAKATAGPPGSHETVYEVGDISYSSGENITYITLGWRNEHKYNGITETCNSIKLNPTSTGHAVNYATTVQSLASHRYGSSHEYPMMVSGGWNRTTGLRTGETWFIQRNTNAGAREGRGLLFGGRHIHVEHLGFLRYYVGILCYNGQSNIIRHCTAANSHEMGISSEYYSDGTMVDSCTIHSNGNANINCQERDNWVITNSLCHSCFVAMRLNNTGVASSINNKIVHCAEVYKTNTQSAFYSWSDIVEDYSSLSIITNSYSNKFPSLVLHSFNNNPNDHRLYSDGGNAVVDLTQYHSGDRSWKLTPSANLHFISTATMHDDAFIAQCESGESLTMYVYLRKTHNFNGEVWLEGRMNNYPVVPKVKRVISDSDKWERHSITIPAENITSSGPFASLRVYVYGTSGNIWIDTFGWE